MKYVDVMWVSKLSAGEKKCMRLCKDSGWTTFAF